MSILKGLLILLLIFFPFGELIRFSLGNNIILKPLDIISALTLIISSFLYLKNKEWRRSLKWYFFFFPLIGLFSLVINSYWLKPTEFLVSFLYLLRWVSYMSIFFAVIQTGKEFRNKIISLLFIDGGLVVLIGFSQYFFYPNLKNLFYLGWDDHLYRLFSSFLDPNFAGAFFVLYLIFVAGFLFIKGSKNTRNIMIKSIILIVTLIATFLTYSRSALIMLIATGVTFFSLLQKKKFILYLFLIIGVFILVISPFFYVENIDIFRLHSSFARLVDIQKGITIFKDHPLIGVGFDSYRYAQIKYHYEFNIASNPIVHSAAGTDNSFIFILATTGIVGLLAYLYMWYQLGKKAWKIKNRFSIIFLTSLIGLFIDSFFNNSLFYAEIMIWLWIITSFIFEKE